MALEGVRRPPPLLREDSPLWRLLLLLTLLSVVSALKLLRADRGTPVTLAAGALLLCGLFAGKVAKGIGLPRLTGYLLIGILIGPDVLQFIPLDGVAGIELVKGLAVSLIALMAGTELRLGLLRRVAGRVLKLTAAVAGIVFVAATGALLAMKPMLGFLAPMTWPQAVAVAALTATVIVSFSPTVTIAIVQETHARGSFTDFLMALVIIGDLVVMVFFALAVGFTKASFGAELDIAGLAGGVGWELFGSLAVGSGIGLITLIYLRRVGREVPLFLCAVCFVSAELGNYLHLSPLLLSLAAGAVIANLDEGLAGRVHSAGQRAGLPVFALFFAAAGAGLHLDLVRRVGLVAIALVAVRALAIYVSTRRFAPGDDVRLKKYLWLGLISQAGVTFGLAALLRRTFPGFGAEVEVLIIAMVTMHELVGPILTRRALERSGEALVERAAEKV